MEASSASAVPEGATWEITDSETAQEDNAVPREFHGHTSFKKSTP